MEDGDRLYSRVEVFGEEVPKDFGPEEAVEAGCYLVDTGCEDDESSPVVLDKLSHLVLSVDLLFVPSISFLDRSRPAPKSLFKIPNKNVPKRRD